MPDARLPRWERLHRQRDFARLRRHGRRRTGRHLVLVFESKQSEHGIGIAVGRPVGEAVTRSAVRRRIREAYRHLRHQLAPAHTLIIARPMSAGATTGEISRELEELCRSAGLLRTEA